MTETKDDLTAQRDALLAENENLRGQLAAAGAARPGLAAPAEHQFVLSEGDRQELELRGAVNIGGRMVTREQVLEMIGGDDRHARVEIAEVAPEAAAKVPPTRLQGQVEGVDFVYPSVQPGSIDPAVAGTPGIHGPAAE